MKDTPPAIERKFRQMLLERSGEERLKMGCSMHATARALVKVGLLQRYPGARPAKLKRLLFLHFYGADFAPEERNRIATALSKSSRRSEATEARVVFEPAETTSGRIVAESPPPYRPKRRAAKRT